MGLPIIGVATSTGALREAYRRMKDRPVPQLSRPVHGGPSGIIQAHSLDPELIDKVFTTLSTLDGAGPLSWPEREVVNTITSSLNHSSYCTACHAESLRVALDGKHPEVPRALVEDPRAPLDAPPRLRALAELAAVVTLEPWALSRSHREQAYEGNLCDDEILHAIALSACFGHLSRIASVVEVPLDYTIELEPPRPSEATPAHPAAPIAMTARPAIELSRRPATAAAIAAWRSYMFDRDAPLTRRQRTVIARWVAFWLGDGGISVPTDLTVNPLDDALRELAEQVTLAPWRITDQSFTQLRNVGFEDEQLFDACVVASSAGVFSRLTVALAALSRERS